MKTYLSPRQRSSGKKNVLRKLDSSDPVIVGTGIVSESSSRLPPITSNSSLPSEHSSKSNSGSQMSSGAAKSSLKNGSSGAHPVAASATMTGGSDSGPSDVSQALAVVSLRSGKGDTQAPDAGSDGSFAPVAPAPQGPGAPSGRRPRTSDSTEADTRKRGRSRGEASNQRSPQNRRVHRSLSPRGSPFKVKREVTNGADSAGTGGDGDTQSHGINHRQPSRPAGRQHKQKSPMNGDEAKKADGAGAGYPVTNLNRERRISLQKLNKKIASIRKQVKNQSGGKTGRNLGVRARDNEIGTAAEHPENADDPATDRRESRRDQKELKRLERAWGELEFVLRRPIESDDDIAATRTTARASLEFLEQLDKKAAELNILRGTLSRLLLPYNEGTAAATQRAATPLSGDSPSIGLWTLKRGDEWWRGQTVSAR